MSRFSLRFKISVILVFFVFLPTSFPLEKGVAAEKKKKYRLRKTWIYYARRLYGESETTTKQSVAKLKTYDHIDLRLKRQIKGGRNRHLALDVVAALKKYDYMPLLLDESKNDPTGLTYLTINTLINSKNRQQIADLYLIRVNKPETSLASKIVLIDTLGRLKQPIAAGVLGNWIDEGPYELQSAALNYLRRNSNLVLEGELKKLLAMALQREPYQVRLQTLHNFPGKFLNFELCMKDENSDVKAACSYRKKYPEVKL